MSYTRTDPFNPLFNRSQYTSMLRKSAVTHVTAHVRLQIILNKSTVDQIPSISTTSSSLNSLFRVLFIFPSRYLFAIGLSSMFSLRWSIPPLFKLHSQATWLLTECVLACLHSASLMRTGVSPSLLCSSKHVLPFLNFRKANYLVHTTHTPAYHTTSLCCIPTTQILGLGFGVFPFHSPLLRKSWLFSFPPLIKMLQFSGLILFKLRF